MNGVNNSVGFNLCVKINTQINYCCYVQPIAVHNIAVHYIIAVTIQKPVKREGR